MRYPECKVLYAAFVTYLSLADAARVGETNGIENVCGLDEQPMICMALVSLLQQSIIIYAAGW
jgi:hypothetical protein